MPLETVKQEVWKGLHELRNTLKSWSSVWAFRCHLLRFFRNLSRCVTLLQRVCVSSEIFWKVETFKRVDITNNIAVQVQSKCCPNTVQVKSKCSLSTWHGTGTTGAATLGILFNTFCLSFSTFQCSAISKILQIAFQELARVVFKIFFCSNRT